MIYFDPGCARNAIEKVFQILLFKRHNPELKGRNPPGDSVRNSRAIQSEGDSVCIPRTVQVPLASGPGTGLL